MQGSHYIFLKIHPCVVALCIRELIRKLSYDCHGIVDVFEMTYDIFSIPDIDLPVNYFEAST